MRALTAEEIQRISGGDGTTLSTITVTGHRPQPYPITFIPNPLPFPPIPAPSPPTPIPMPSNPPCSSPANGVNANMIYNHEGSSLATTGYVPGTGSTGTSTSPSPTSGSGTVTRNNSGLTLGYGVDLGQLSATQLAYYLTNYGNYSYGKGADPYALLAPYVGVRGPANVAAVAAAHGGSYPTISTNAASALTAGALTEATGRAANDYQTATDRAGLGDDAVFFGLPSAVQTVLADISFVFGSIYTLNANLPTGVLAAVGNQDWQTLATLLLNAPAGAYQSRLKSDGQALQNAINSGKVPAKGTPCS